MSKRIKPTLGKGLNSMLGGETLSAFVAITQPQSEGGARITSLPLSEISPNPNQPRQHFDEEALEELAASIRHLGIVQPITVQRLDEHSYQIISGERRYRAAERAGLSEVPVYVREVEEGEVLELALVENIQREDLNAIEIALAYQGLSEQTGATHEAIAERVGKKRTTISNYIRLLRLPAEIQLGLSARLLDMGHARALLQIEDTERQLELYHLTIQEGLSVREVEELAKAIREGNSSGAEETVSPTDSPTHKVPSHAPEVYRQLERHLGQVFGAKIRLRCNAKGKGSISIPFGSEGELERLIALLERIQ